MLSDSWFFKYNVSREMKHILSSKYISIIYKAKFKTDIIAADRKKDKGQKRIQNIVIHLRRSFADGKAKRLYYCLPNILAIFQDKTRPLHHHYRIRSGVRCFWGLNSSSSSSSSILNVVFENSGNDLNNKENFDTSETESCLNLPKAKGIKQSEMIGVPSSVYEKSIKRFRIY